jgi:hypothetical protein
MPPFGERGTEHAKISDCPPPECAGVDNMDVDNMDFVAYIFGTEDVTGDPLKTGGRAENHTLP